MYLGSGEGESQAERAEPIGRQVSFVCWGFCEKAFRQNGMDQYKAAVLGLMHWIPILCVFPLFKFELESTVPVMWHGRCSREAVLLGRVDTAVHGRSTMICRGQ